MKQLHVYSILDEHIKESIEFIRKHEPSEGYFLGFSGGKDSVVLYDLTKRSGVKFQAYYSATGIDPPELVKFIREKYPDVVFCRPKESFFALIPKRGYPTKWSRWCCDYLKKQPTKHIPLKHRLMGIRAEESAKRAARGRVSHLARWNIHYKPIFEWLEWEIWDYIEENNISYCSLYDEGFDRLGCVVCPFLSNKRAKINKERWPKIYTGFEKSMKKLWETKFYHVTFDQFLDNWYLGILTKQIKGK